jgi:hypothetical protein
MERAAVSGRSQKNRPLPGIGGTIVGRHSGSRSGLLDLPRRIMGDVHSGVAASPSQRRHCVACKWLTPSDSRILAGAARDDMGAAIHEVKGTNEVDYFVCRCRRRNSGLVVETCEAQASPAPVRKVQPSS